MTFYGLDNCVVIICVILSSTQCPFLLAAVKEKLMQKIENSTISMVPLGYSVDHVSQMQCASLCLTYSDECYSIYYNRKTQNCILGTWLVNSNISREPNTELYTQGAYCNDKENFKVLTNGSVSSCLQISYTNKTYSKARVQCKTWNSHLYTIKKIEKLYFLKNTLDKELPNSRKKDTWVWVGLNDLISPGVYKWEDDGSVLNMNSPYKLEIFKKGEPDHANGTQFCIAYSSLKYYPLHNNYCSYSVYFICEKGTTLIYP